MSDRADLEAEVSALEVRVHDGETECVADLAYALCTLGEHHAVEGELDAAHALYQRALAACTRSPGPRTSLEAAYAWDLICFARQHAGDAHGAADAAGEAHDRSHRTLPLLEGEDRDRAVCIAIEMGNELASYHRERDHRDAQAGRLWNQAIALHKANPQLPLYAVHAHIYFNRGLWESDCAAHVQARASLDRAIELYLALNAAYDAEHDFDLAKAWRIRGNVAASPDEADSAYLAALSFYERMSERITALEHIGAMHNDRGNAAFDAGRFQLAEKHYANSVAATERLLELDPTRDRAGLLAAYRVGCIRALGRGGRLLAAIDAAHPLLAQLEDLASEATDDFVGGRRQLLAADLDAWVAEVNPAPAAGQCSFCQRKRREVKKLIAGPSNAFICDSCVGLSVDILAKRGRTPAADGTRCAFCDESEGRAFIRGPMLAICHDCIDQSAEIIEGR